MMRTLMFTGLLLLACSAWPPGLSAHGLDMSTASISVRDRTHVLINLRFELSAALQQMNSNTTLTGLSVLPVEEFEQALQPLIDVISGQLLATHGNSKLTLKFRFPPAAEIRSQLRRDLMGSLTQPSSAGSEEHGVWIRLQADGLLVEGSGALEVRFPVALAPVLVTYSEPETAVVNSDQTFRRNLP